MKNKTRQTDRVGTIFQKAIDLFIERGYDNTPLSLVARETGLSKAGIYHYFESKEHLLYLIHKHDIEENLLPILEKTEAEPDPDKRLRGFIHEFINLLNSNHGSRILIHETKRLEPSHYQEIIKSWQRLLNVITDTIGRLQEKGKASKTLNKRFTAFSVIGMCVWTSYWFDRSRPESIDELARTFASIFMNGIKADI